MMCIELLTKANFLLREALQNSQGENLRVVIILDKGKKSNYSLDPSDFSSRQEWRKALIAQQKEHLAGGIIWQTIKRLKSLSLTVYESNLISAVVVEGNPDQIIEALKLKGVLSATLDHVISI